MPKACIYAGFRHLFYQMALVWLYLWAESVSYTHLDVYKRQVLRTLGESTSFNISQALVNAKNLKSFFVSTEAGKFKINHIGEDHVDKICIRDRCGIDNHLILHN